MRGKYNKFVKTKVYNPIGKKWISTASNTFLLMVNGTFQGDVEETRRQLLEYCELDTYAMVKILKNLFLKKVDLR